MKHMIGICLKDNVAGLKDGYIKLSDKKKVEFIAYVDGNKKDVEKYTAIEFMNHVQEFDGYGYIKYDANEEVYTETVDIVAKQDMIIKTGNDGLSDYRNTSDVVLFKKNDTIMLQNYKGRYYFWRNNDFLLVLNKDMVKMEALDYKLQEVQSNKIQISSVLYDVFAGEDLRKSIYTVMCYFVNELGYSYETAQTFVLNTFNVSSNKFAINLNKRKLQGLLGLTSGGMSGEKNLGKATKDSANEGIREIIPINFADYIDNYEVYKTATGRDVTNKDLVNILETFKEDIEENLKSQKAKVRRRRKKEEGEGEGEGEKADKIVSADDITKEANAKEFKVGNPSCSKCKGKGYILIDFFGTQQKVKCDCVDRYTAIQSSKKEPFKNAIKIGGEALDINMMTEGLIPRKRAGDLLDFKLMGDRVAALCKASGETVDTIQYEGYKNAMRNVLSYLIAHRDMDYSLLISAPNGFGKTTFVYSCLKLMLLNGYKTVPFVPLFELAQLRYDYMLDKTWRRAESYSDRAFVPTDTENQIMQQSSYNNRLQFSTNAAVKERREQEKEQELEYSKEDSKKFVDMTDSEKERYIMQVRSKKYNYQDYLDADILFCQLSVAEQAYMEISTLKAVMEYRGMHCKPTIIITDRDIEVYKTTVGMATDIHFLNEMLINDIKYATYDRAFIVSVKKIRATKLKIKVNVDV